MAATKKSSGEETPSGSVPWGSRVPDFTAVDGDPGFTPSGRELPDPEPGDMVILRSDIDLGRKGTLRKDTRCLYVSRDDRGGRPVWTLFGPCGQFRIDSRWVFYRERKGV